MLKRLAHRALERALSLTEPEPEPAGQDDRDAYVAELEDRVIQLDRIRAEYFTSIERFAKERDRWKSLYFKQASLHTNAQAIYERELGLARKQARACVAFVRKHHDDETVQQMAAEIAAVTAPPVGKALEYGKELLRLAQRAMPHDTDAQRELARLSEGGELSAIDTPSSKEIPDETKPAEASPTG